MTLANLLIFTLAYITAVASPGPAVAVVLARTMARGLGGISAYIGGVALGDLVWFFVAALGLAAIAQTYDELLFVIKIAGAAYLIWLACRLWTAPAAPPDPTAVPAGDSTWQLLLGGLAVTLGKPKPIVFFMAILPTIMDLTKLTFAGMIEIALIIPVGSFGVMGAYVIAADRARRLFTTPKAVRTLNHTTAVGMAGAAVAVARA